MTEADPQLVASLAKPFGSVLEALNLGLQFGYLFVARFDGLIGDVKGNHSVWVYFAHGIKGR